MTPQEIFDTVARHLFEQGTQAYNDNIEQCRYRGPGGTKCAVGCLIPDEAYDPEMEGWSVDYVVVAHGGNADDPNPSFPAWLGDNLGLLSGLQDVHDLKESWDSEDTLRSALATVAQRCNLNDGVLIGLKWGSK